MASYLTLSLTQISQNIANNTSLVNVRMTWTVSGSTHTGYTKYGTIVVNGSSIGYSVAGIDYNQTKEVYNANHTISHDNITGAKTLNVSANLVTGLYEGTITTSASKVLTTIPRASTPTRSAYSTALGSAVTIYTNRASTAFTHTITYSFGGASGTIATGVGTSVAWAIPKTLANQIPSAVSGVGTIYCYTYSGSTYIGVKSVSFATTVPDTSEFKPSISNLANVEAIAGLLAKFGGYVQNKSKVNASMSVSTAYGSSIVTATITIDGTAYSGANVTSATLKNSGTITITYYAKDARGRTYSTSISIAVLAYSNPSPTGLTAYRCDVSGNLDDKGAYSKVLTVAEISSVNSNNDISYKLKYKKTSDTIYTEVALTSTAYAINIETVLSSIDVNNRYDVVLEVTDYFMTASKSMVVPTGFTLMDFKADGTGIAFGKVAENSNEFDVDLASRFRKEVYIGEIDVSPKNHVLWTSASHMSGTQTAVFYNGAKVSEQKNGIVLCFSRYSGGILNEGLQEFFVPKEIVALREHLGHSYILSSALFEYMGTKYLYIHDTYIGGHDDNIQSGTASNGINYVNTRWVLTHVIGV